MFKMAANSEFDFEFKGELVSCCGHCGWYGSKEKAMTKLEEFENVTVTKFVKYQRCIHDQSKCRILWQSYDTRTQEISKARIPYDGMPYTCISDETRECEHGIDRKEKYKEERKKCKDGPNHVPRKRYVCTHGTKKMSCCAVVRIIEIIKYPEYRIEIDKKKKRAKASEKLRDVLHTEGHELRKDYRCYVHFPSLVSHTGHPIGMNLMEAEVEMLISDVRVKIDADLAEYYSADTESLIKLVEQTPAKKDLSILLCTKACSKEGGINSHYHCPGCMSVLTSPANVDTHWRSCVDILQHKTPQQRKALENQGGVSCHDIVTNGIDCTTINGYDVDSENDASEADASETEDLSTIEMFDSVTATLSQPFLKAFDFMDKDAAERLFTDAAMASSVEFSSFPSIDPRYPVFSLQGSLEGIARTESLLHQSFRKVNDSIKLKTPVLKDLKLFSAEENELTESSEICELFPTTLGSLNTSKESHQSSTSTGNAKSLDSNSHREATSVSKQYSTTSKRLDTSYSMLQSSKKTKTSKECPDGEDLSPTRRKVAVNLQDISKKVLSKTAAFVPLCSAQTNKEESHKLRKKRCFKYACSYCSIRFLNRRALSYHTNTHTGSKPYKCTQCGKSFAYLNVLIKHKRLKHGVKGQHNCAVCLKTFRVEEELRDHVMVSHTRSSEYKCDYCHRDFHNEGLLRAHLPECKTCNKTMEDNAEQSGQVRAHLPECKTYNKTMEDSAEQSGQVYKEQETMTGVSSSIAQTHLLTENTRLEPRLPGMDVGENTEEGELCTEKVDNVIGKFFLYMCSGCQTTFNDLSSAEQHTNQCQGEPSPETWNNIPNKTTL